MIELINRETGNREVLGVTNSTNIIVDDPFIVTGATTLSDILLKQKSDVEMLKSNVKWLYKYGGTGSGGGTGGGGTVASRSYFQVTNTSLVTSGTDNVIYVSENNIIIRYKIFNPSNNIRFTHSVYLNDQLLADGSPIYSNVVNQVVLSNLNSEITNVIRFVGADESGFNLVEYIVKIVSGSIIVTSSTVRNNGTLTKYYGTGDFLVNISITNRVKGASTVLEVKLNNKEDGKLLKTFNSDGLITYNLKVIEELNGGQILEVGTSYNITIQAFTTISNQTIPSSIYRFSVSLMDSTSLVVSLTDISEATVEDDDLSLKSYLQGSDISFFYTVNAASYNTFRMAFELVNNQGETITTVGSIYPPGTAFDPFDSHDLWLDNKQVSKGISNNFSYSTNRLDPDQTGVTYVNIYTWSSDGSLGPGVGGSALLPTKVAKCKIEPAEQMVPNYTNANKSLYVDMNVPLDFSDLQDKSSYTFSNTVLENAEDVINNTRMDLLLCNNVSSGFILNSLTDNYPALRVSGGAYTKLYIDYFKGTDPLSWTKNNAGFTFSITFKSDQHPDANGTIFSYSTYDDNGNIVLGIEVTLEGARMVYSENGTIRTVNTTIVQNTLNTVDFVCEKNVDSSGLMKIYLNGVLTSVDVISDSTNLSLGIQREYALVGCNEVDGELVNFCDVNIYNIRIYKSALLVPEIIKNYIINFAYLNKDFDNNFDWALIDTIKARNFIDRNWNCILWDTTTSPETWKSGYEIYSQVTTSPVLPVILLTESNSSSTFRLKYEDSYNETNAAVAQEYHAPCTMYMTNVDKVVKRIPDMSVTLQGTSSMSYSSKNLEIYFGVDGYGKDRLFTPTESWLPENRFTLKADVIDSAHANNTAIGKFINESGFFDANYAMNFSNNPYAAKVKHTLEGFPVYVFIRFGDKTENDYTFLGIYNFNLGRGSNYNLGFKVLSSYELEDEGTGTVTYPAMVKSYTELVNPYNNGVFSFEINTNSPTELVGFQQADLSIVNNIVDQRYPDIGSVGDDVGWSRLYNLFDVLSKMYSGEQPEKWKFENNQYVNTGEFISSPISPTMEYFPTTWNSPVGYINWPNANKYLITAIVFGMIDSLGKNLTLRTWNAARNSQTQETSGIFYTSFYDMDTALGLDNYGSEDVPSTIYIDYWYNEIVSGYTRATKILNGTADGVKGYDMPSSRLWAVVRDMINKDPGNVLMNYQSYWSDLRRTGGLLSNVDDFIDTYYVSHTRNVGEIMYNLDYSIKYLKKYFMENPDGSKSEGYNDVKFLHGNRRNYVKSWLNKRLKYIDGCMNIAGLYALDGENNTWVTAYQQSNFLDSPYVQQWSGRGNGSNVPVFEFDITSNIPTIFCMNIATTTQRIVLNDNDPTVFTFKGTSASSSTMSWNNTRNISRFKGFDQLNFSSIGLFPMSGLLELDLSNIHSFDNTSESNFNISNLTELRTLDLENTTAVNPQSGFIVDVEGCLKLKTINIRNSHVGTLVLPGNTVESVGAGVLSELLVSGSLLNFLSLQNQQFLTTLDFSNCQRLQTVNINSLINLTTIVFSNNSLLQEVVISNCPNLTSIVCQGNRNLLTFTVDVCNSVTDINLNGCNNGSLIININGAYNLESLNLSNVASNYNPILPSYTSEISNTFYDTLTTLNLSNSKIKAFDFGQVNTGGTFVYSGNTEPILDLSQFNNLTSLNLTYDSSVKFIKFNNNSINPYSVGTSFFNGCTALKRVFGHVRLAGTSVFSGCISYYVHEPEKEGDVTVMTDGSWRGVDTSVSGRTDWDNNINLESNITYGITNLNGDFASTFVSLYDVYYLLSKAGSITSISSMFSSCNNIYTSTTDPLNRYTFNHCGNVTNASSLFSSSRNMKGPLFSPTRNPSEVVVEYNGLLSPLISLTGSGMDSMFYGCGFEYMDDYFFWQLNSSGAKLKITSLNTVFFSYYPDFVADVNSSTMVYTGARASKLLTNLPNLTSINYMFNNNEFYFDTITFTTGGTSAAYCPLFFNNTGLTSVVNSFNNITARGSWENLFGGQEELRIAYPNNFPKKFSTMRNSFIVTSALSGSTLQYPIRNDMFNRIKNSITYIGGTSNGVTTETSSLSGVINKTYDPVSNDNESFPYHVFEGCVNLVEAAAFFNKLNYTTSKTIELPGYNELRYGSILFKDCTKLENLCYAFANMTGVSFTLSSRGFINCNLKNVDHIFYGNTVNMKGKIPYGLFYMETTNTKTVRGWLASQTAYTENYGFEDGVFLGTGTTIPTPVNNDIIYKDIKRTITNMSYALANMQSPEALPYTLEMGGLTSVNDSGDVTRYNEKYNPVKYILNSKYNANIVPEEIENPFYDPGDPESPQFISNPEYDNRIIIINPEYNSYYRVWNEWCVDGTNIDTTITGSTLYETGTTLPVELPENFYDINNTYTAPTSTSYLEAKYYSSNYVLPPDMFRYCYDNSSTVVDYFMAYSNREGTAGDDAYGLRGRISPKLFEPLTQVTQLRGVFRKFIYLCPYSWNRIINENEVLGEIIPENLLTPIGTRLRDVSELFMNTTIHNKCVIPVNLFYYNTNLQNLTRTFSNCRWDDSVNQQLPNGLFSRNYAITSLNGLFGNGTNLNYGDYYRGPYIINSALFNSNHKNINDIAYFMNWCSYTTGTIPEFWVWTSLNSSQIVGAFNGLNSNKITNLTDVINSKYGSAVTNVQTS